MAIVWDQKYSVGISVIDEQHKQFIFIMDKLSKAISKAESKDAIEHIFFDLEKYVQYHFGTEEKYFREFNYVDAEEHIIAHREFEKNLKELKDKYRLDENKVTNDLISFMFDWLTNHIQTLDRKYTESFRQNGLI